MNILRIVAVGAMIAAGFSATAVNAQDASQAAEDQPDQAQNAEAAVEQSAPNPAGFSDASTGTDSESIDAQFAAGRHDGGKILANVGRRFVMGNNLMLDIVFQPTSDGLEVDPEGKVDATRIYSGVAPSTYEQMYLIAGDKKYMLVTDSNDKISVTQNLQIEGEGPVVGQWTGVFPAPPTDTPVMLYLPEFSPIGPFSVPSN
ncbi:hypothetical protein FQV27_02365 [Paracoccus aurantiacus]|uniref:Uncharacterized protein n=1 Tax=Paracoccus aurantiacus TaxID=2599412 RepID=A0A5C6S9C8_9RHOB|nr:hypothetical protein [Paracoccus aurantiacus]TXB70722.1 hypothetical protein FQV27_02365 [Paracoccus aurantiacus]